MAETKESLASLAFKNIFTYYIYILSLYYTNIRAMHAGWAEKHVVTPYTYI